jgi:hypothetical protein
MPYLRSAMWIRFASFLMRNRWPILLGVMVLVGLAAWQARGVQMSYEPAKVLPDSDSAMVQYQEFLGLFGEQANVVVLAVEHPNFFSPEAIRAWDSLESRLNRVEKIEWTLSPRSLWKLRYADQRFEIKATGGKPASISDLDSLPFYREVLWNAEKSIFVMFVGLDEEVIHTARREAIVFELKRMVEQYQAEQALPVHISGLPYIRTETIRASAAEIKLFVVLAALVTSLVLLFFFRSLRAIAVPLVVVGFGVVISGAALHILDFKITSLIGLIPPLLIVIGVPNAVYMITKYHQEFARHRNQMKSLTRMVFKTGKAIFLTNLTTAVGFGTLAITKSELLVQFGLVAFISIMGLFVLSIVLTPIIFSFLPEPKPRHLKHLERKGAVVLTSFLQGTTERRRTWVFGIAILVFCFGLLGMSRIEPSGKVSDDMPVQSKSYQDLQFFERHFEGVMPFEVMVKTNESGAILRSRGLWRNINALQDSLTGLKGLSRSVSVIELIKYANQSMYNGAPEHYDLPNSFDASRLRASMASSKLGSGELLNDYLDSSRRVIRVRARMADMGTPELNALTRKAEGLAQTIFENEDVQVYFTGAAVVLMKSADYLIRNLMVSLLMAILIISVLMAMLFKSYKMVFISMVPNLLPLFFTAGVMGWAGIPLKASNCLVFGVAFGISVDDTIHFLSRYRQLLATTQGNIKDAVLLTLNETGLSMAYTSIILFFGFSIFMASDFGGTVALGMLVSLTLLVAMFTNLTVLPALLMGLHKEAKELPFIEEPDEDETEDSQL